MENKKGKQHGLRIAVLGLVLSLLVGAGCVFALREKKEIKDTVASMKNTMRSVVSQLAAGETERAESETDHLKSEIAVLQEKLDSPIYKFLGVLPVVGEDLESAEKLCAVLNEMTETLIRPTIVFLNENPVKSLTTGSGINSAAADNFLAFYQQLSPALERITGELGGINLALADPDGKINGYLNALGQLSDILGTVGTDVIEPLRVQLAECPLDNIKVGDGFDINVINNYLDFLDVFIPECRELADKLDRLELGELDANGTVAGYTAALQRLIDLYDNNHEYIDLVRAFTGDGGDRYYLIGAQNSSETYASGGFPGAMGMVYIENGVLNIGEFIRVYDTLNMHFGYRDGERPTSEERNLFPGLIGYPWDAGYTPDFERVAQIWNGSFNNCHYEELSGVVSLTPVIIGKLLPFIGDIELSDGTTLNADNATAFIQFVIYDRYVNEYSDEFRGDWYCDDLFAEIAQKTMSGLVKSFSIADIPGYIQVLEEAIADRTVMIWFSDENEQNIARAVKCSGGLGHDPNEPQIGVFLSIEDACKMGWWLDVDYELSEPIRNEDGSRSYEWTLTLSNNMTNAERGRYSNYITCGRYGVTYVQMTVTGPAGGRLEDCYAYGVRNWTASYQGLPVYTFRGDVYPEDQIVATGTVTTAPGVDVEPTIIRTPTLTEYRLAYLESVG